MNGFTKKIIGTMTLGEKLQKLRSDRRLSLSELSKATRIQIKYLEGLEKGEYENMPAEVYVKGFLRSYADFFGVDEQIFLKLYKREKEIRKNLQTKKDDSPITGVKPVNISPFVFTPKNVGLFVISVIVFLGMYMLYREIDSFASAPSLIIFNPENNTEILGDSVYIEGSTDKDAKLYINDHPILVGDEGRFRENLTLQNGPNVINVKSVNKFDKETVKTISVISTRNEKNDFQSKVPETSENVSMEVQDFQIDLRVEPGPVWLKVEADGELVFNGTMLSGAIQTFKAKNEISISSGKGNATFLTLDGKDIGVLGNEPKPIRDVVFLKNGKLENIDNEDKDKKDNSKEEKAEENKP